MIYSLRKVSKEGIEDNLILGANYSLCHIEKSPEDFKRIFHNYYGSLPFGDDSVVYGFLTIKNGSELIPLSKGYKNYIVSDNGNTYQNLTFK